MSLPTGAMSPPGAISQARAPLRGYTAGLSTLALVLPKLSTLALVLPNLASRAVVLSIQPVLGSGRDLLLAAGLSVGT